MTSSCNISLRSLTVSPEELLSLAQCYGLGDGTQFLPCWPQPSRQGWHTQTQLSMGSAGAKGQTHKLLTVCVLGVGGGCRVANTSQRR